MRFQFRKFALIGSLTAVFAVSLVAGQKDSKAKTDPPATPQAKTTQPATHFTQGTITSINADQLVITRQVRGKAEQMTFTMNSQTQRSGSLVTGARASVQYRENNGQKIAAAVRELPAEASAKNNKTAYKPRSKN